MRRIAVAIAGATPSAIYWWLVATLVFGLLDGDPGPDTAPRAVGGQQGITVAIVAAVIRYATASAVRDHVTRRL